MMHGAVGRLAGLDVQLPQQSAEGDPCALVPDADSDRAILVVRAHRDDCPLEPWISHSGHREKHLARQETRLLNHA
jgi:hypothetical protein